MSDCTGNRKAELPKLLVVHKRISRKAAFCLSGCPGSLDCCFLQSFSLPYARFASDLPRPNQLASQQCWALVWSIGDAFGAIWHLSHR